MASRLPALPADVRFRVAGLHVALVLLHAAALAAWAGLTLQAPATSREVLGGAALAVVGLTALLLYQALPQPDSEPARRVLERWSVALHLAYTTCLATCLALWAFADYAATSPTPHEEALKVWFLSLGFFGGFLNLTRSTGTRATASTIHATTRRMARQLELVRQGQRTNAELYAQAVNAQLATDHEALGVALVRMVDAARAHPTIPASRLTVSLWVKGRGRWRILAGSGISDATREQFTQPVVAEPTAGAGVVASLAASGDTLLVEPHVERHPWYRENPLRAAEHSGIAVVLIEDFRGAPMAALCLTARPGTLLPHHERDAEARDDLVRLLMAWKIAFTLPMLRLVHRAE